MSDSFLDTSEPTSSWRRYGWPLLILAVAAVVYATTPRPSSGTLAWSADYDQARRAAAESGRPILLEFYSPSCPACMLMDRDVLAHPKVEKVLASFERVKVNAWDARELSIRFGVEAVPAFLTLDAGERLLGRAEGYVEIEDFNRFLTRALKSVGSAPDR